MHLIPTPGELFAAAGNAAHLLRHGGFADLAPTPRTVVSAGSQHTVSRFGSEDAPADLDPVLLVAPLAAPSLAYDLRQGCSLAGHLAALRPTYLLDFGVGLGGASLRISNLGLDPWADTVLPSAIRTVSEASGGRPVHLVGWSLGGLIALLAAADSADLPLASVVTLGTPVDPEPVPMVAPDRPLLDLPVDPARLPVPGLPWLMGQPLFQHLVTDPLVLVQNLDRSDRLAQFEAVDRLQSGMPDCSGRTYGQVYHRFVRPDPERPGSFLTRTRSVALGDVVAPVLVVSGADDQIAPADAVIPLASLLTGSTHTEVEVVPGGHVGLLTGRRASSQTWPVLDEWFARWQGATPARRRTAPPAATARRKAAPKKAAAKKAPAKKVPAKKAAPRKTASTAAASTGAARKAAPRKRATKRPAATTEAPSIGANPERRYSSAGSRSLNR